MLVSPRPQEAIAGLEQTRGGKGSGKWVAGRYDQHEVAGHERPNHRSIERVERESAAAEPLKAKFAATIRPPPPDEPDSRQQDDALRKGLGRAVLWAQRGRLTDEAVLLESCLHDRRYERLFDGRRGAWLWQIVEAAGVKEKLREPLLESLRKGMREEDGEQLCQLALHYTHDGDPRFAHAIRDLVARGQFYQNSSLGEEELIRLDGIAGLLFAARVRGNAIEPTGEWHCDHFIWLAGQLLGEKRVRRKLAQAAESDSAVKRFYEAWQESGRLQAAAQSGPSRTERLKATTVAEVINAAETGAKKVSFFRSWGFYASDEDLRAIQSWVFSCQDSAAAVLLLHVLSRRALPEFDERLLNLLHHTDRGVRTQAVDPIALYSHPSIRNFIEHANGGYLDDSHIELFVRNFCSGDEDVIAGLFLSAGDNERLHGAVLATLNVLDENPQADCSWLAYRLYESSPCGHCRGSAARMLLRRQLAPDWLGEECRYDSEPDTRALVDTQREDA